MVNGEIYVGGTSEYVKKGVWVGRCVCVCVCENENIVEGRGLDWPNRRLGLSGK